MKTHIFKEHSPENAGLEFWKVRFSHNGTIIEDIIGRVDELTNEEAEELGNIIKLSFYKEGVLTNVRRQIKESSYPTLRELASKYIECVKNIERKKSWDRDIRDVFHLNRFFGELKLNQITQEKVKEYRSKRLNEKSRKNGMLIQPSTVNKEVGTLRRIFNYAIHLGIFHGDNPLTGLKKLPENNCRGRVLTPEEERRLLEECPYYLAPIVLTAIHTAMRKSEIIFLKWKNVDLKKKVIYLDAEDNKSKKDRIIALDSLMIDLLETQLKISGHCDFVFLNSKGTPYKTADSMKNTFNNACKRAGIEDFCFHDLRRSSATLLHEYCKDMKIVSRQLGHSNTDTTERYVHPLDKAQFEAVELIAIHKSYHREYIQKLRDRL